MTTLFDQEKLRELLELLNHPDNIGWDTDPQGSDYWHEVFNKLCSILEEVDGSGRYIDTRRYAGGSREGMFRHMYELLRDSFSWNSTSESDYWTHLGTVLLCRSQGNTSRFSFTHWSLNVLTQTYQIEPEKVYEEFLI